MARGTRLSRAGVRCVAQLFRTHDTVHIDPAGGYWCAGTYADGLEIDDQLFDDELWDSIADELDGVREQGWRKRGGALRTLC
jgi:hypothetical protein